MLCPKCGTGSYSIEKERSTYSRTEPVASLVFACSCGKRVYGKKVEEEYLRQKKIYDQDAETRERETEERIKAEKRQLEDTQAMSEAMAFRARFEAKQLAKRKEEATRSSEQELEKWREQAGQDPDQPGAKVSAGQQPDLCTWHQCDKGPGGGQASRRKGSKYCSRDCSNKNARWRHKKRKANGK